METGLGGHFRVFSAKIQQKKQLVPYIHKKLYLYK